MLEIQSCSKLILQRLIKIRYFKFLSEFSRRSVIRGQFPDSRAKTRGIVLILYNMYVYICISIYLSILYPLYIHRELTKFDRTKNQYISNFYFSNFEFVSE